MKKLLLLLLILPLSAIVYSTNDGNEQQQRRKRKRANTQQQSTQSQSTQSEKRTAIYGAWREVERRYQVNFPELSAAQRTTIDQLNEVGKDVEFLLKDWTFREDMSLKHVQTNTLLSLQDGQFKFLKQGMIELEYKKNRPNYATIYMVSVADGFLYLTSDVTRQMTDVDGTPEKNIVETIRLKAISD